MLWTGYTLRGFQQSALRHQFHSYCLQQELQGGRILIGSGSFALVKKNFIPLEFSDSVRFMVHVCMLAMSDCDSVQSKGSGMIFKISGRRYIWSCYVSFNHCIRKVSVFCLRICLHFTSFYSRLFQGGTSKAKKSYNHLPPNSPPPESGEICPFTSQMSEQVEHWNISIRGVGLLRRKRWIFLHDISAYEIEPVRFHHVGPV